MLSLGLISVILLGLLCIQGASVSFDPQLMSDHAQTRSSLQIGVGDHFAQDPSREKLDAGINDHHLDHGILGKHNGRTTKLTKESPLGTKMTFKPNSKNSPSHEYGISPTDQQYINHIQQQTGRDGSSQLSKRGNNRAEHKGFTNYAKVEERRKQDVLSEKREIAASVRNAERGSRAPQQKRALFDEHDNALQKRGPDAFFGHKPDPFSTTTLKATMADEEDAIRHAAFYDEKWRARRKEQKKKKKQWHW